MSGTSRPMSENLKPGMDGGLEGGSPLHDAAGAADTAIVRAEIHPGIGVARLGDSIGEFFVGPEVTEPAARPPGFHRDSSGALKRQAARFRVFGYNSAGQIVRELTAENADIRWTVHLANKKAGWYRFLAALDIPDAATMSAPRRNASVIGNDRAGLIIDPGPRSIAGSSVAGGPEHAFDTGKFKLIQVVLGEIQTDEAGRLLVLGGHGCSGSPSDAPILVPADADTFSNADDWFDDISDGPVTATIELNGTAIPVSNARVVVGPPNYAPDIVGWRTLYELLEEVYMQAGWLPKPAAVSFTEHVLPVLRRLTNLQWVNQGFAAMFGKGCPMDFSDDVFIAKLAQTPNPTTRTDPFAELRQVIFDAFRPFDTTVEEPRLWPWIYGDAFGSFPATSPRNILTLPSMRTTLLKRWVEGDFVNDWNPAAAAGPRTIDEFDLSKRPAMLDRAALHFCLADAFHPGCEITWPMRHLSLYEAPFRIRHGGEEQPDPDYGATLTQEIALGLEGPLNAQGPGDITRWMAIPWQGDSAGCRSGYDMEYDPYLPTFWPARVPNQVLTEDNYRVVVDETQPREVRIAAFNTRRQWFDALKGSFPDQMKQMAEHFGKMGLLEIRPGVRNDPDFPDVMMVEILHPAHLGALTAAGLKSGVNLVRPAGRLARAGWESEAQFQEFRGIRIRHH